GPLPRPRMLDTEYLPWLLLLRYLFFFNRTANTDVYTLSLHDALPILRTSDATGPRASVAWRPERPALGSMALRPSLTAGLPLSRARHTDTTQWACRPPRGSVSTYRYMTAASETSRA